MANDSVVCESAAEVVGHGSRRALLGRLHRVETALYYTLGRLDTAVASLATDSTPGHTAY